MTAVNPGFDPAMDSTQSIPAVQPQRTTYAALPRATSGDGIAPLKGDNAQLLHLVLFVAGAVLLPLGLVVIGLGWYGVAHTAYEYNQLSYLMSGGILGLGIVIVGGFLYFGAWMARVAADQKDASKRLADTLLVLADAVAHATTSQAVAAVAAAPVAAPAYVRQAPPPPQPRVPAAQRDPGSVLVTAGSGSTVHRADCDLLVGRDDLQPAGPDAEGLTPCRLCHPERVS
jgi:hypothetical protein